MTTLFITGAAGFIASTASEKLLKKGYDIIGIDNFCDYYDVELKRKNIEIVRKVAEETGRLYTLIEGDIRDKELIDEIFAGHEFAACIH